ncbi:hypothetical protein GCM10012278_15200 [Nonomuraea glycinis]|uniref:Uncharacterized protein n=1 Tax=Nonomuraea glycinis TaxID=2047744 RepID=A0A918A4H4_9ACTN|nr:hypothetical protein GCM10012278_15200 [Nonomuraea glycinis]
MVEIIDDGVLSRETAPVVGLPVVPVALRPTLAVPAEQHAPEGVRTPCGVGALAECAPGTRFRSPFDSPPKTPMIMSWASFTGSIGPPTSGTHSGTPKCSNHGNVRL